MSKLCIRMRDLSHQVDVVQLFWKPQANNFPVCSLRLFSCKQHRLLHLQSEPVRAFVFCRHTCHSRQDMVAGYPGWLWTRHCYTATGPHGWTDVFRWIYWGGINNVYPYAMFFFFFWSYRMTVFDKLYAPDWPNEACAHYVMVSRIQWK